ncbi:MAG: YCF48-related protein [Flavobacteriales bacterium]
MQSNYARPAIAAMALALAYTGTLAQGWVQQVSGTNVLLEKVKFVSDTEGWIVGDDGTILHTTDGGDTWLPQTSGTTQWLRDLQMLNANEGWAVGANSTVLHTVNGGMTWVPQTLPAVIECRAVFFTDAMTGWISGTPDIMLKTTTGGASWTEAVPASFSELNTIWFTDALHGWAGGLGFGLNGQVRVTSDGGNDWVASAQSLNMGWFQAVQFLSNTDGWACTGGGEIVASNDGGIGWDTVMVASFGLYDLCFIDPMNGWICGEGGNLLHTMDGGANWLPATSGSSTYLYDIEFSSGGDGWIVGWSGTILHRASSTSVAEDVVPGGIMILMDPALDQLVVKAPQGQLLTGPAQIYDAKGQLMLTTALHGCVSASECRIRLGDLPGGWYALRVGSTNGDHYTARFLKP